MTFVQMASPSIGRTLAFEGGRGVHGAEKFGPPPPPPLVIVDGMALAYFLFQRCETCRWWDGGDMRAFDMAATEFVRNIRAAGMDLRVVFDGMVHPLKHDTVLSRMRDNARRMDSYLAQMRVRKGAQLGFSGFVLPFGAVEDRRTHFSRLLFL